LEIISPHEEKVCINQSHIE